MAKKLSTKSLIKLKLLRPDLADFVLRLKENENDEKISSTILKQESENKEDFRKIKTIIGRDGIGISDIDLVNYELVVTMDDGRQKTLGNIRGPAGKDGYKPSPEELISLIKPLIPKVSDGKDGKTPTKKDLISLIKPLIPDPIEGRPGEPGKPGRDGSPDSGVEIINKINSVDKSGPKIKAEHIENFKEEGKKLFQDEYIHRGGTKIRIKEVDGSPNITELKELIVPNGSLTNNGNGSVSLSISGGGGTVETPVGDVDGTNNSYTVSNEPKWIVADGITYFDGAGYTYSAGTLTLDTSPVSFIRSIY